MELEHWAPPRQEEGFAVQFGAGGAFGMGVKPAGMLDWTGKAELRIGPDGVVLRGRSQRSGQEEERRFDFDGIRDAHCVGTVVRFDVPPGQAGQAGFVKFDAREQAKAYRILELLPRTQSRVFHENMLELGDFRARLAACSGPPRVTPVLVALNAIVFVAMLFDGAGLIQANGAVALRWGSNFGPLTASGEWWRLLTSAFIHYGLIHLAFNMYALWDLGGLTERLYGRGRFLWLYLFAALTGSLGSLWWNTDPPVNAAGASGAIFGLLGGLLAFVINARNGVPKAIMKAHRNSALLWGGYSLLFGAANAGLIDNAAHVGGLLGGFTMGWLLARPVDPQLRAQPGGMKLAGAFLAGALMLGAAAWAVMHPGAEAAQVRDYERFDAQLPTREHEAIQQMQRALEMSKSGNGAGFRAQMAGAAQKWAALENELRAIEVGASVERVHRRELYLRYIDARRRYCELLSRYSEGDDTAPIEAVAAQMNAAIAELKADGAK
jgi:rhomboid protease GluP